MWIRPKSRSKLTEEHQDNIFRYCLSASITSTELLLVTDTPRFWWNMRFRNGGRGEEKEIYVSFCVVRSSTPPHICSNSLGGNLRQGATSKPQPLSTSWVRCFPPIPAARDACTAAPVLGIDEPFCSVRANSPCANISFCRQ